MKKKTGLLIAGGLALGFTAYAAGIWSLYNQDLIADAYQDVGEYTGFLEPLPPAPEPKRYFITAGAQGAPDYMPQMAADGCSADGKVVRLVYETAIIADDKRLETLSHPRIAGDLGKYDTVRRETVAAIVKERWKEDVAVLSTAGGQAESVAADLKGLDFSEKAQGDGLESWLQKRLEDIHQAEGLQVVFRVNAENGISISEPKTNALDACSPEGFVPQPLIDTAPPPEKGLAPF